MKAQVRETFTLARKNLSSTLGLLIASLAFASVATAAEVPKLTFKFTTVAVKGAENTAIYGTDNAGDLVGMYVDSSGVTHGFLLRAKLRKLETLDDPKGTSTLCQGINSAGWIVGGYTNSAGNSQAFLYRPKSKEFHDLTPPGSTQGSYAVNINDNGWVAGFYTDSAGVYHGFLLKDKRYRKIDAPGATGTLAYGVNNNGLMTVQWINSLGYRESSLYNGNTGKFGKTINVPGAVSSYAHSIDTEGDVVFVWYDSASNIGHGALRTVKDGKFHRLDDPKGAQGTRADGINDHGLIVGNYTTIDNVLYGFKATY